MKPFNLEEYLTNPSRKIVTREGKPARIICTDAKFEKYPVLALITKKDGQEFLATLEASGKFRSRYNSHFDLFFAPEKHEGWVNVYEEGTNRYLDGCICVTKEEAKRIRGYGYITTIKIEWEE